MTTVRETIPDDLVPEVEAALAWFNHRRDIAFEVTGIAAAELSPRGEARVKATAADGAVVAEFDVLLRLDTAVEVEYYRHGGILPFVLRELAKG